MERSVADFLAMGGYAPYVWSSYGAWCVVMLANLAGALGALKAAKARARRRFESAASDDGGERS